MARHGRPSPSALLDGPVAARLGACAHLRGYHGVHGGLALAMLARRMLADAPGHDLVSLEGRFVRAMVRGTDLESRVLERGRTAVWSTAVARDVAGPVVTAAGLLIPSSEAPAPVLTPAPPPVAGPDRLPRLRLPANLAAVLDHLDLRNAGSTLPFGGHRAGELRAWVRILGDDQPPDAPRTVFLLDALVSSYTAVLSEPALIPIVELSVHLDPVPESTSSWLLLHARTTRVLPGGWLTEEVDAWTREGAHLAHARQLRLMTDTQRSVG